MSEPDLTTYEQAAAQAAVLCADDDGDALVVLEGDCPHVPGEQGDDGVRAVAAIQLLRHLVDTYEDDLR